MNGHFQIRYDFSIFYKFLYFWNALADISKCGKSQTWVTGRDATQKTKHLFDTIFGTDAK